MGKASFGIVMSTYSLSIDASMISACVIRTDESRSKDDKKEIHLVSIFIYLSDQASNTGHEAKINSCIPLATN